VQNLGPVFTAIAARRKYIYIAATAGIELYTFCSICCNKKYNYLQQLLSYKMYYFTAIAACKNVERYTFLQQLL
jgi:hypothetical protein